MARTATLAVLRAEVRKRADVESETARHPDDDVTRYINQAATELRDLIIEVRGRTYFRKSTPQTITTLAGQTKYPLNTDFLRLISIRKAGVLGFNLNPFTPEEEPALRYTNGAGSFSPTNYELQPGTIEILPAPTAGLSIVVEYIPAHTDLVADGDTLDGYDGWEEYVVVCAARMIAVKDDELELARALDVDMKKLTARIQKLAPTRDAFRAERVKDARQTRFFSRFGWRY